MIFHSFPVQQPPQKVEKWNPTKIVRKHFIPQTALELDEVLNSC